MKIYCEGCGKQQPFLIEEMKTDELNGEDIWGDIVCEVCFLVICTMSVEKPGFYEFRRILP